MVIGVEAAVMTGDPSALDRELRQCRQDEGERAWPRVADLHRLIAMPHVIEGGLDF